MIIVSSSCYYFRRRLCILFSITAFCSGFLWTVDKNKYLILVREFTVYDWPCRHCLVMGTLKYSNCGVIALILLSCATLSSSSSDSSKLKLEKMVMGPTLRFLYCYS